MFDGDFLAAPFEVKFADNGAPGTFEGYGSVFGNVDSHGDIVMPGAFADTLAERKAQGRNIAMHVMHGFYGGDGLPAGVWTDASEDSKGLHLKGRLSGMDTDYGKRLYGLVKDGALGGLSIGFNVPTGGAVKAVQGSGASRQINRVNLHEVSLVDDPSNAASRVTDMKRRFERWGLKTAMTPDKATASIAAAIGLHQASLKGGHPPTQEECDAMLQHLQEAHEALTGAALPITRKSSYAEDFRHVLETLSGLGRPSSFLAGFSLPDLKGMSMGGSGKTPFGDLMSSAMKEMNADMSKAKMTGNPDHDFAAMMVPHHVGAVAMAQAELDHGKDPAMRALATSVISGQDAQIKTMRDWLKAHIS